MIAIVGFSEDVWERIISDRAAEERRGRVAIVVMAAFGVREM